MNPRLEQLIRQRAMLAEHLGWLDREIAQEQGLVGGRATQPAAVAFVAPSASAAGTAVSPTDPMATLTDPDVKSIQSEVRRGCLIYAAVGTAIIVALMASIYLKYR
jgi:hypothetical protein